MENAKVKAEEAADLLDKAKAAYEEAKETDKQAQATWAEAAGKMHAAREEQQKATRETSATPPNGFDPEQVKRVLGEDSVATVDALEKKANELAELELRLQTDREVAEKKIEEERREVETMRMELQGQHDKKLLEDEHEAKRHR